MRGLISLAVIFFIALSGQASAKTFIECVAETTTFYLSDSDIFSRKIRSKERFLFSFDADNGSRFENPKIEGTDCIPTVNEKGVAILSEPDSIDIYCEEIGDDLGYYKIEIHRISGEFVKRLIYKYPIVRGGVKEELTEGWCKKVKPKF